jgi:hypothetical protein
MLDVATFSFVIIDSPVFAMMALLSDMGNKTLFWIKYGAQFFIKN